MASSQLVSMHLQSHLSTAARILLVDRSNATHSIDATWPLSLRVPRGLQGEDESLVPESKVAISHTLRTPSTSAVQLTYLLAITPPTQLHFLFGCASEVAFSEPAPKNLQ